MRGIVTSVQQSTLVTLLFVTTNRRMLHDVLINTTSRIA